MGLAKRKRLSYFLLDLALSSDMIEALILSASSPFEYSAVFNFEE